MSKMVFLSESTCIGDALPRRTSIAKALEYINVFRDCSPILVEILDGYKTTARIYVIHGHVLEPLAKLSKLTDKTLAQLESIAYDVVGPAI